jgi:hypothetical protein
MSASHIRIDTVIETGDGCFSQNGFRKDLPHLHLQYYNGEGRKSKVLPPPLLPPQVGEEKGGGLLGFKDSRGLLNGQFKGKGVRISIPLQRKDATGMRIDSLKDSEDVDLSSLRLLPEFVKVMGRQETHIVAD